MDTNTIWLIDHKATLGDFSPMNLDGSTWILGVCILTAASTEESAISKFKDFLKNEDMELIEIYDLREYVSDDFNDDSSRSAQIKNAVRTVLEDGETCYVYARTSETMESGGVQ